MSLNRQDVKNIAWLARLEIDDSELASVADELSNIVALVEQLAHAPVAGVEPMAHPLELAQRLRPDVVTEAPSRDRYQQDAPEIADGLYLVPRVLE